MPEPTTHFEVIFRFGEIGGGINTDDPAEVLDLARQAAVGGFLTNLAAVTVAFQLFSGVTPKQVRKWLTKGAREGLIDRNELRLLCHWTDYVASPDETEWRPEFTPWREDLRVASTACILAA